MIIAGMSLQLPLGIFDWVFVRTEIVRDFGISYPVAAC
jgi:hypothetical protein